MPNPIPYPLPNRPDQFQIDQQWLENYLPALKYGAKIDGSQIIGGNITVEDNGVLLGVFDTLDFIGFTIVDNGDGSVSITDGSGAGITTLTSVDGSVDLTPIVGGFDLSVDVANINFNTINWSTVNWTDYFTEFYTNIDWTEFITEITNNWTSGNWDTFIDEFITNVDADDVTNFLDQAPGSTDWDIFRWDQTAGEWVIENIINAPGYGGGGSAETVSFDVTQTAHGFSVGDVVRSSGTDGEFTESQADNTANAEVTGIVSAVAGVNDFTIVTEGFVTLTALPGGAAASDILFLDPSTAGALTLTEPTTAGQVSKPIAEVIDASANLIYFHNYRGQENQATPTSANFDYGTITNASSTTESVSLSFLPSKIKVTASWVDSGGNLNSRTSSGIWTASKVRAIGELAAASSASTTNIFEIGRPSGGTITGVISNVTSSGFDIVVTNASTLTVNILWEAED